MHFRVDAALAACDCIVGSPAAVKDLAQAASEIVAGERGSRVSIPWTGGRGKTAATKTWNSPVDGLPGADRLAADNHGATDDAHLFAVLLLLHVAVVAESAEAGDVVDAGHY